MTATEVMRSKFTPPPMQEDFPWIPMPTVNLEICHRLVVYDGTDTRPLSVSGHTMSVNGSTVAVYVNNIKEAPYYIDLHSTSFYIHPRPCEED